MVEDFFCYISKNLLAIFAIILTLISIYYTHWRKLILDISVKGLFFSENFDAHLPFNIKDEYKDYIGGFNLIMLLNFRIINQNLIFNSINVKAKLNDKEYSCITHTAKIVKNSKYKILNFINYLEKNKSDDYLFQFFLENCNFKINEIESLTITLEFYNFKKMITSFSIDLDKINFNNIDPNFLDEILTKEIKMEEGV